MLYKVLLMKLSDSNKKYYLNLSLYLAKSDGMFSDVEKKLIDTQCAEMGIDNNGYKEELDFEELCQKIRTSTTNNEKKIIFIELISLAFVDEEFADEEKEFVEQVKKMLEIPDEVANQAIDIISNIVKYTKTLEEFVEW